MRLTIAKLIMSAAGASASMIGRATSLSKARIILASASPRRLEIFDLMGLAGKYEVVVSRFEENLDKIDFQGADGPARYTVATAMGKAREVASRLTGEPTDKPVVVVGCDTIVDLDGEILEKPQTKEHAKEMLRRLSGRSHNVHSGVSIFSTKSGVDSPATSFVESTRVAFAPLSEAEIDAYVESGEPMDKAGSYGIQGLGGQFVERIEGCYFNVMGLPMRRLSVALAGLLPE